MRNKKRMNSANTTSDSTNSRIETCSSNAVTSCFSSSFSDCHRSKSKDAGDSTCAKIRITSMASIVRLMVARSSAGVRTSFSSFLSFLSLSDFLFLLSSFGLVSVPPPRREPLGMKLMESPGNCLGRSSSSSGAELPPEPSSSSLWFSSSTGSCESPLPIGPNKLLTESPSDPESTSKSGLFCSLRSCVFRRNPRESRKRSTSLMRTPTLSRAKTCSCRDGAAQPLALK
mmetsp:Transcript_18812/g.44655  ORF Transcript_18812/g.44655 Transcript_18812/m.44655 type:complete len:229 (-) Transcript_18812:51-737(-)